MPAYDYRCTTCGLVLELTHKMSETVTARPHEDLLSGATCEGPLERLIALVGVNQHGVSRPLSDQQLARSGFTKYVRGSKGYEKAAGPSGSPDLIPRP
jgi:putative FmdB family regulatory protein